MLLEVVLNFDNFNFMKCLINHFDFLFSSVFNYQNIIKLIFTFKINLLIKF
jgi:hypothetical protein